MLSSSVHLLHRLVDIATNKMEKEIITDLEKTLLSPNSGQCLAPADIKWK